MKTNITLLFLLFFYMLAVGQSDQKLSRKMLESFHLQDFAVALEKSQKILETAPHRWDACFVAGVSASKLRRFEPAAAYLSQIPDNFKNGVFATTDFHLALAKKSLGEYEKALAIFQKYAAAHASDQDMLGFQARQEVENCRWAMTQDHNSLSVNILPLADNVNTDESDLAPLRFADKIYFTSTYREQDQAAVSRIFSAIQNDPARLISENPDDLHLHAANVALTPDASTIFYTICQDELLHQQNQCEIFYREKQYEGHWNQPRKLDGNVNLKGYTTMQPSIGWDKTLKKYVLFFVSNRPGGKGGLDIWASAQAADGSFEVPECLPFNTEKDEVSPYFYMPAQTLFFSSNGGQGFGGFDIFTAKKIDATSWSVATNLGLPVNGGYDDLYFTYHINARRGYFSSNRPGARCTDFSAGCLCCDLFEVEFLETPAFILGTLSQNSQTVGEASPPCFSIRGETAPRQTTGGLSTQ